VVAPSWISHFSLMVKIPIRISATGLVKVNGNKAALTVPSKSM